MKHQLLGILKKRRISQTVLAKEIGITPSFLSHILAGRRRLGINKAIQASKLTGIPLEKFYQ
jgi:transcriptional regulator with XRE-family HTH domain